MGWGSRQWWNPLACAPLTFNQSDYLILILYYFYTSTVITIKIDVQDTKDYVETAPTSSYYSLIHLPVCNFQKPSCTQQSNSEVCKAIEVCLLAAMSHRGSWDQTEHWRCRVLCTGPWNTSKFRFVECMPRYTSGLLLRYSSACWTLLCVCVCVCVHDIALA